MGISEDVHVNMQSLADVIKGANTKFGQAIANKVDPKIAWKLVQDDLAIIKAIVQSDPMLPMPILAFADLLIQVGTVAEGLHDQLTSSVQVTMHEVVPSSATAQNSFSHDS